MLLSDGSEHHRVAVFEVADLGKIKPVEEESRLVDKSTRVRWSDAAGPSVSFHRFGMWSIPPGTKIQKNLYTPPSLNEELRDGSVRGQTAVALVQTRDINARLGLPPF